MECERWLCHQWPRAWTELRASSQDSTGMQSALKQTGQRVPADPYRRCTSLNRTLNAQFLLQFTHTHANIKAHAHPQIIEQQTKQTNYTVLFRYISKQITRCLFFMLNLIK